MKETKTMKETKNPKKESILQSLLHFLFGKQTHIFNKEGRVEHDLGENKWKTWNDRLKEDPNYDFRNHSGKTKAESKIKTS